MTKTESEIAELNARQRMWEAIKAAVDALVEIAKDAAAKEKR